MNVKAVVFIIGSIMSINTFPANIPKGGVFKFAEPDGGGGGAEPLDMPLALPIANFFGYARSGNTYYYDKDSSLPIAINVMYIESASGQLPDSRIPEITDDNYDFSEHYLHFDTGNNYSWVSGGKEGNWGLPIINAKPYVKGQPFPAITACSGTPTTLKEQRYNCKPGTNSGTRNLSSYDTLISVAESQNQKLWVGSVVFPSASSGPEGNTSNTSTGGEGHEMVIYLPHRHMSLIHLEAILLGGSSSIDRRLASWSFKSEDGVNFVPYYIDSSGNYAFVSTGSSKENEKTEVMMPIPGYLNSSIPIVELAAIHTRIGGGLKWTVPWGTEAGDNYPRGSDIFVCVNGVMNTTDDYTNLSTFENPNVTSYFDEQKRILPPAGQKGFTFSQLMGRTASPDNSYICDTKGTQLFSERMIYKAGDLSFSYLSYMSGFMMLNNGINQK